MSSKKQQSFRTRFPSAETQRKETFKQLNQNKKVADIETLFKLVDERSVSDGNKGDVIISDGGQTYTLADGSVTNEKIVSVDGSKVSQSPNYRLVTDAQIASWTTGGARTTNRITANYLVTDNDRNIECDGVLTVTFPLLAEEAERLKKQIEELKSNR